MFRAEILCLTEVENEVWLGWIFKSLPEASILEDFFLVLLAMTISKNLLLPAGGLGIFSSITGKGLSGSSYLIDSLGTPRLFPSLTLFFEVLFG